MSEQVTKAAAVDASKRTLEQHVARLQAAFARALGEEDLVAIARTLIDQAREGDTTSARLVLKYALGSVISFAATEDVLQQAARKAAEPTAEQLMQIVNQRMAEQEAFEAELRGRARPGAAPRLPERRPGVAGR